MPSSRRSVGRSNIGAPKLSSQLSDAGSINLPKPSPELIMRHIEEAKARAKAIVSSSNPGSLPFREGVSSNLSDNISSKYSCSQKSSSRGYFGKCITHWVLNIILSLCGFVKKSMQCCFGTLIDSKPHSHSYSVTKILDDFAGTFVITVLLVYFSIVGYLIFYECVLRGILDS